MMVWVLLLAHFLGDYPLQPSWVVRGKARWPVLALHGAIHFGVMAALFWAALPLLWPWLLALAVVHISLDAFKIWYGGRHPGRTGGSYLLDQLVHVLTILLLGSWLARVLPGWQFPFSRALVVTLVGLLLVTHVWLITERVLAVFNPPDRQADWPRLLARGLLFGLLLWSWQGIIRAGALQPTALFYSLAALGGVTFFRRLPYLSAERGARRLVVDVLVAVSAAALVIAASY